MLLPDPIPLKVQFPISYQQFWTRLPPDRRPRQDRPATHRLMRLLPLLLCFAVAISGAVLRAADWSTVTVPGARDAVQVQAAAAAGGAARYLTGVKVPGSFFL